MSRKINKEEVNQMNLTLDIIRFSTRTFYVFVMYLGFRSLFVENLSGLPVLENMTIPAIIAVGMFVLYKWYTSPMALD